MTLRRRSFDDEAAQEAATDSLLRRFDALTDPPPTGTAGGASVATPRIGPIEATYLVAASNARDSIKEVADFVCNGVGDHVEINAAWEAIEAQNIGGGRVVLSAGTFSIADKVTVNTGQGEPGVMIGAGQGATLIHMASGSNAAAVRVRAGATIRDFSILVDSTATLTTGALELTEGDARAFSISIETDEEQGIWIKGPRSRVEACRIKTVGGGLNGIFVHKDAFDTILTVNHITETRQHGIFIDADAGGTTQHVLVLGNRIINPSRQTANTWDGIQMEGTAFGGDSLGPLIEGNIIYKTGGGDFRDGVNIAGDNNLDVTIGVNAVGAGVGRWAINLAGLRCTVSGGRYMGGINVPGDDNHIEGVMVAIVNDASNGIVVGGDRNSVFDNKVFPQSGTAPAVGLEIESGAVDNVVGINDLGQATTPITDAGTGTIYKAVREALWIVGGTLGTQTGVDPRRINEDILIIDAAAVVDTAPTDASLIVDVHLNGTTIFTTQGNRPTIVTTATDSGLAIPDVTAAAGGDVLTVDIDQIGSTVAGADLAVVVRYVNVGVTA